MFLAKSILDCNLFFYTLNQSEKNYNMKKYCLITIWLSIILILSFSCQRSKPSSFAGEQDTLAPSAAISTEKIKVGTEKGMEPAKERKMNIPKDTTQSPGCNIIERYQIPLPTQLLDTSYLGTPDFSQLFPTDSASRLIKSYNKAFYFGVYSADLVYTTIYDNRPLFYQYYATVMQLSNDLGIKETFTSELLEQFRENYHSDTVEKIISQSITRTCRFLDENNQIGILPFMIVGSWSESIYLTIGNAIYNESVPMNIYRTIAQQDQVVDKLKRLLDDNLLAVEDYNLSLALHNVISDLDSIKQTYQDVYLSDNISIDKESLSKLYRAFARLKYKYL